MTARVSIGVATAAVLLAACGSSPTSTGGSPSPSATVTPTPAANTLIVIAEYPQSSPETTPIVLHLVRPDGTEATRLTLIAGAITTTASGSRIFVVERGGALKALHRDGSVEELGNLASTTPTPIVASPDGNSWLWGTLDTNGKGTVYAGTKGASPRVVDQSTETARAVRPYSWTQRGPAIEHGAVGIGGYILFYTATGPIDLVDPASASITSLNGTTDCSFSDLATNGMNACFPHGKGHTLSLMAAGGQVTSVALPADRFAVEGAAYFSPNGDQVIVGGATVRAPVMSGSPRISSRRAMAALRRSRSTTCGRRTGSGPGCPMARSSSTAPRSPRPGPVSGWSDRVAQSRNWRRPANPSAS